ncbi:circadian clock-controlled protein daywake [Drosophila tropicalis]|uniref:circadian clock-controlled protein daywake n=1 Tax=Drosophila tropicalis TaxID=46794 RepID=UPI0035AC0E39
MSSVLNTLILVTLCGCLCWAADAGIELPHLDFKPIKQLPADIPTCQENDLNINECIKQAFQQITPRMKYGISELNIPALDPYELGKSSYNYNSGLLQGRIAMKDVVVHGLSEGIMDKVDFRLKNNRVRMELNSHIPKMFVEGLYKADIKLNDLKLTPKGRFNVTLTDVSMRARPMGELYERDGHTYLRLTKFETEPKVGDLRFYANGLVPDPALNDVILDFINQYWRQLYEAMLPETLATWQPLILKTANDFFAALPFDMIVTKS